MELKINFHFHTADDPHDAIDYTFYEGMERAKKLGFQVMALTCHEHFVSKPEYREFAKNNGILLIEGIEKKLEGAHIVILNCDKEAESLKTLAELSDYRRWHPEIFVLAPHPFMYGDFSLKEKLAPNIHLFDAIELSWFYSKKFNRNKPAAAAALKYKLPLLATSDTHDLGFLNTSYAVVDAFDKTPISVFDAIKIRKFKNVTSPRKFFREMVWFYLKMEFKKKFRKTAK